MIHEHLPILQVVAPLIAAPICLFLRRRGLAFGFTLTVCGLTFGCALMLLARVLETGFTKTPNTL